MTSRNDHVLSRLSSYVDGDLAAAERAAIAEHLDGCDACRLAARDLDRLRSAARTLGPMTPPDHVWLEVAGQIHLETGRKSDGAVAPRRAAMRQWIGLAAALLVVTLGAYFFLRMTPPAPAPGNVKADDPVQAIAEDLALATQHYEKAIGQLDELAKSSGGALDPAIAQVLQQNLAAVDKAIDETRGAVKTSPDNVTARESLIEALRRKVDVLQATVSLMNEIRKGDQAGAAQAAAALGKKG
jgi:anti-sigma factor RsiW